VRTQKRQGPQINLLRPNDTIEVIRTACSICHVRLLNKAEAVSSTGATLEIIMPPVGKPLETLV
jgi:hypothetical protein